MHAFKARPRSHSIIAPLDAFTVFAQTTTNAKGEYRFGRVPVGQMLGLRVRPPFISRSAL